MPLREISRRGSEHVEPLAQLGQHRLRREHLHARRRQLDREGQSIEPAADLGDGGRVLRGDSEVRAHRARALDEEPHRIGLREHLEGRQMLRVRYI